MQRSKHSFTNMFGFYSILAGLRILPISPAVGGVHRALAGAQRFFAVSCSLNLPEQYSTGWHCVTLGHFLQNAKIQDGRHKLRGFCDFRPLDFIFLYENVTPML